MMDSAWQRNSAFPIRNDINWNICQNTNEFVNTMNAPPLTNGMANGTFQPNIYSGTFSGPMNGHSNFNDQKIFTEELSNNNSSKSQRKRKSPGLQRGRKVYISEKKMMTKFSQMNLDLEHASSLNENLNMVPLSNRNSQRDEGVIIEEFFDDDELSTEEEDNVEDCPIEFSDVLKNHLDQKNQNVLPDKIMNKIMEPCRELVLWQPPALERLQFLGNSSTTKNSPTATRRQALKATRHFTGTNSLPRVGSDGEMDCSATAFSDDIANNAPIVELSPSLNEPPAFPSNYTNPVWSIPSCSLINDASWPDIQDEDMMS